MLGEHGRNLVTTVLDPVVDFLAKWRVSPNLITVTGTTLTVIAALTLIIPGHTIIAPLVLAVILFADSLDGQLARKTGQVSRFGEYLDSTLDRIGDTAVFASFFAWSLLNLYDSDLKVTATLTALALILTPTISYARAKAESLGVSGAKRGLAERTDRLVISLVAFFLIGIGLPLFVFQLAMTYLVAASAYTILQRSLAAKAELSGQVRRRK